MRGNRCSRYLEFLRCSPGSVFLHLLCPINVLVQLAPATLEEFKAFMPHGQKKRKSGVSDVQAGAKFRGETKAQEKMARG